jgi:hypothetical protein
LATDAHTKTRKSSAWAATRTRALGLGRGTAGDEQHQSKAEVGVVERCTGKVDVEPERGAMLSWSSRARKRWTAQHGMELLAAGASEEEEQRLHLEIERPWWRYPQIETNDSERQ